MSFRQLFLFEKLKRGGGKRYKRNVLPIEEKPRKKKNDEEKGDTGSYQSPFRIREEPNKKKDMGFLKPKMKRIKKTGFKI